MMPHQDVGSVFPPKLGFADGHYYEIPDERVKDPSRARPAPDRWPTLSSSNYSDSPPDTLRLQEIQALRTAAARRAESSWETVLCEQSSAASSD